MKTVLTGYFCISAVFFIFVIVAEAADTVEDPNVVQSTGSDFLERFRAVRAQLRQDMISPLVPTEGQDSGTELQKLIDQMESLEIPRQQAQAATVEAVIEPAVNSQSGPAVVEANQPEDKNDSSSSSPNRIEVLVLILEQSPEKIIDPLSVGEALFMRGDLKSAAGFYELALSRNVEDQDWPDRPWALFQGGNCLRENDPERAYEIYQELISEYSGSHWAAAAHLQQQIITWYKQNDPLATLEEYDNGPDIAREYQL